MSADHDRDAYHDGHALEAIYARREARADARHAQAILDERALSQRRADSLVQIGTIEDPDFEGCYW